MAHQAGPAPEEAFCGYRGGTGESIPSSVWEVEKGSPSVAIGIYVNVLMAIGMVNELDHVLADDPLGRLMQDSDLPTRERRKEKE